jgi:hypothetical protein
LYASIDRSRVVCLNEREADTGKLVFKPACERRDKTAFVQSPSGDPALLFQIPFTSAVRIRAICISGGEEGNSATTARLYVNREGLDFSSAEETEETQKVELAQDPGAEIWYPLKASKFSASHHLTVALSGTFRGDEVLVYYIGLKGTDTKAKRAVVEAVYESKPTNLKNAAVSGATAASFAGT